MFSPGLLLPTARRHLIPLAKPDRRRPPAGSPSPSANSARFTAATVRSLIDEQGFADQAAWCRWPSRFRAHARRHRALRCNDGNLYAFSAAGLAALWSYAVPGNPQIGSTAVSGGTVYVTTTFPRRGRAHRDQHEHPHAGMVVQGRRHDQRPGRRGQRGLRGGPERRPVRAELRHRNPPVVKAAA
jgi:hypothetical protein